MRHGPEPTGLLPGEFVADQNYSIALVLELISLWLILGNTQQFENFRSKIRHTLFRVFLMFEIFILIQVSVGITVNEGVNTALYPGIARHYENLVYTAL